MENAKCPVIFVIDRNPIHSSLIKYHLNINRFLSVQVFRSGEEYLSRLHKNIFSDFLISDFDIGDMDGFELMEKAIEKAPETRIIFLSSNDDSTLAIRLLEAGATDYILKTSKLDIGIGEMIKNVKYLCQEANQAKKIY